MTERLTTGFALPVNTDVQLRRALEDILARHVRQINLAAIGAESITSSSTLGSELNVVDASAGTVVCTLVPAKDWIDRVLYIRQTKGISLVVPQAGETVDGTATAIVAPMTSLALVSDGTSWYSVSKSPGWTFVEKIALSGSSAEFSHVFEAGFMYQIRVREAAITSGNIYLEFQTSGGSYRQGASDYYYSSEVLTTVEQISVASANMDLYASTGTYSGNINSIIDIDDPLESGTKTKVLFRSGFEFSTGAALAHGFGYVDTAEANDQVRIANNTGSMSGSAWLYRIAAPV